MNFIKKKKKRHNIKILFYLSICIKNIFLCCIDFSISLIIQKTYDNNGYILSIIFSYVVAYVEYIYDTLIFNQL